METDRQSGRPPGEVGAAEVLRQLGPLAAEVGAGRVADAAMALAGRLDEGRFFVACVGQFKRGKSTLLNALVGDPVLPTGVVPVTSVVTVLRHGPRRTARVRLASGTWHEIDPATLAVFVTEAQNPQNRKAVDGLEVVVPSPLLRSGMCLVDTPGIGSVFSGSTKLTRDFVPQIDAAVVVLGADPSISGDELALVAEVASQTDRLIFVLNKADRLSDAERREARRFAELVLRERLPQPVKRLFEVSATERLAGQVTRDWSALEAELEALARHAAGDLLRAAGERGVGRLADRLLHVLDEHRDALVRPFEESERRLAALRHTLVEAERALKDLAPLFEAEQAQLAGEIDDERRTFLARALPTAARELDEAGKREVRHARWTVRARSMEQAREIARRVVEQWLRDLEPRAGDRYGRATRRFTELANGLLARLRASGDPALARLPAELPVETGFRAKGHFHFTDLLAVADPGPGRWLFTLLGPRRAAMAAAYRDAREYLGRLLEINSARVSNDLIDRVGESRRRLESQIATFLEEIVTSAERALERARERYRSGAEVVRAELARLEALRQGVEVLRP